LLYDQEAQLSNNGRTRCPAQSLRRESLITWGWILESAPRIRTDSFNAAMTHPAAVGILPYTSSMKASTRSRKSVAFTLEPQIRTIAPRPRRQRHIPDMEKTVYEAFHSDEGITDELLQEAARLFSENYGVWDKQAPQMVGKFAKAGSFVMTKGCASRNNY